MDPSFVSDPSSETGGSRCKTRCPSAAVVKQGLSQYSGEQCVTKTEGGPPCVKTPGGPTVGCGDSPRLVQLCPVPPRGHMKNTSSPLKTIPCSNVRKLMLFNNEEVISNIPPELPFPSTHYTSFRHRCLLMSGYKTRYGHLLALYK